MCQALRKRERNKTQTCLRETHRIMRKIDLVEKIAIMSQCRGLLTLFAESHGNNGRVSNARAVRAGKVLLKGWRLSCGLWA